MATIIEQGLIVSNQLKTRTCTYCKTKFSYARDEIKRIRINGGLEPFTCVECPNCEEDLYVPN